MKRADGRRTPSIHPSRVVDWTVCVCGAKAGARGRGSAWSKCQKEREGARLGRQARRDRAIIAAPGLAPLSHVLPLPAPSPSPISSPILLRTTSNSNSPSQPKKRSLLCSSCLLPPIRRHRQIASSSSLFAKEGGKEGGREGRREEGREGG